jgi:ABC-type transport system involved in cytochrome bd biosynthesis fused ATPase/permease subunit
MFVNCMVHVMESLQDAYLYMVSPYLSIRSLTFIINLLLALLSIT